MAFEGTREKVGILGELWAFMRVRKKWWLGPIVLMLAMLGLLVVFTQGSALAPFIYTVSPRGGLVLCEDGTEYLHGLTVDGEIFRFAQNSVVLNGEKNGIVGDFSGSEFAGATYSPDGHWLFVNIQTPGITFAITGPWGKGAV